MFKKYPKTSKKKYGFYFLAPTTVISGCTVFCHTNIVSLFRFWNTQYEGPISGRKISNFDQNGSKYFTTNYFYKPILDIIFFPLDQIWCISAHLISKNIYMCTLCSVHLSLPISELCLIKQTQKYLKFIEYHSVREVPLVYALIYCTVPLITYDASKTNKYYVHTVHCTISVTYQ